MVAPPSGLGFKTTFVNKKNLNISLSPLDSRRKPWRGTLCAAWKCTNYKGIRCHTCHGHGQTECKTCDALGNLKCFIQLTVTWSNHFEDHIVERTELPEQLIRGVSGQIAFEEEVARVWPITHFPDPTINAASKRLVERHSGAFPTERILLQRQRVRIVPVTEALYRWKNDNGSFYVYGFEHKVHAPKYPQKCCCGCTIV